MLEQRSFLCPSRAVAVILAGGRGNRLYELTERRANAALYFGGMYRIIDFAISNCVNSGIRRVSVLTQYKSHSLLRHLQRGWGFLRGESKEFIDLLPAQQRVDEGAWYMGTADAVHQNMDILSTHDPKPEYVVVLAGDHVYKMNYAEMLADHVESGAECTIASIEMPRSEASRFGVMAVGADCRITDFVEKPADPPAIMGKPDRSLCSMGVYIFNAKYLYDELQRDANDQTSSHDFARDIIPRAVKTGCAMAHSFSRSCVHVADEKPGKEHYWRDVGNVDAYWETNIDLAATDPALNLYDKNWPIWTYQPQLPPAKFVHNEADRHGLSIESLISAGSVISGEVNHSLLFSSCRVHSYARLNWSVVLPEVDIGRGVRLNRCVVDQGVQIPAGLVIGEDPVADAKRFRRTANGITLVTQLMINCL